MVSSSRRALGAFEALGALVPPLGAFEAFGALVPPAPFEALGACYVRTTEGIIRI